MSSIANRLSKLEHALPGGTPRCAACGWPLHPADLRGERIEFAITGDGELRGPDICLACGRVLVLRIVFDRPGSEREELPIE